MLDSLIVKCVVIAAAVILGTVVLGLLLITALLPPPRRQSPVLTPVARQAIQLRMSQFHQRADEHRKKMSKLFYPVDKAIEAVPASINRLADSNVRLAMVLEFHA